MGVPTELALFAGAGGGCLASVLMRHRIVCYVEREPYAVAVLRARIADGNLDDAPIWDDAVTFDGRPWRGLVDIVSAGFPCQPWSVAGLGGGEDDARNGWPDTLRIIRQVRPQVCFLENVPGLLARSHGYFGTILGELAVGGYDARWGVLSAADLGAPHLRRRLWIYATDAARPRRAGIRVSVGVLAPQSGARDCGTPADTDSTDLRVQSGRRAGQGRQGPPLAGDDGTTGALADAERLGRKTLRSQVANPNRDWEPQPQGGEPAQRGRAHDSRSEDRTPWSTEPGICRVVDGVANRAQRLRALGNGQVPLVAATAWALNGRF